MDEMKVSTADRILLVALQLMKDKGFKSVTIKEIAQASKVSEMTVFRHFETKRGVLEAAIKKNWYMPNFKKTFVEKVKWDLEQDLYFIAKTYLDVMEHNQFICLIAIQERTTMPELSVSISEHTKQLQELLATYFKTMQDQQKMGKIDVYAQAMAFLSMLFGYSFSTAIWGTQFISESKEDFIENSVQAFCNGIKNVKG